MKKLRLDPEIEQKAWAWMTGVTQWWARNLFITTKARKRIPFVANQEQVNLLVSIARLRVLELPVRILALKYRRLGVSTAVSGLYYKECSQVPYTEAFAAAHDSSGTDTIWFMLKKFHAWQPRKTRKDLERSNRIELAWRSPHMSHYALHTGGGRELGRSKEVHLLHISERAFYPNAERTLPGVFQCVDNNPNTMVVSETTANGAGGEFYDAWDQAVKFRSDNPTLWDGVHPVFFGWLNFEDYKHDVPKGYEWGHRDEYEQELISLGATPQQLYWRRLLLAEKCLGDPEIFCQEMPATVDQAFRSSGHVVFSRQIIARHETLAEIHQPLGRFVFYRDDEGVVQVREATDTTRIFWTIWEWPTPDCDYSVAGDIAEGELSDPEDQRSEQDWSTGVVYNRVYKRIIATSKSRLDPDLWGEQLRMVAEYYNNAWASPELNNAGQGAIVAFKRPTVYQMTFKRRRLPEDMEEMKEHDLYGWRTTRGNREAMIDNFIMEVRQHPINGWQDCVEIYDPEIIEEMKNFIRRKDGKREHQRRKHDDYLFACFIALMLDRYCPRGERKSPTGHSIDPDTIPRDMKYAGGFDTEDSEKEELCPTTS